MNAIVTVLVVVLHGGEVHAEQPSGLLPLLALTATLLLVAALVVWRHRRRPRSPKP